MKTEAKMWAVVDKTSLDFKDKDGRVCLLVSRDEARSLKAESETVKRVKVTIEAA